jgi:ATPase subunit of ABC transporter with duplicated ATPase domains
MPSIVLSNVVLAAPDGRPLLPQLDLTFGPERTGLVGRNGVGKTTLMRVIAGEARPAAGSVASPGRVAMLRQSVAPQEGETIATLFGAVDGLALITRAGRGEAGAAELAEADWTLPARLKAALAQLGLSVSPQTRLAALSGGQQTRARLAALVFAGPDFLLLDEPTNHLDRDGRAALADLLGGWRAGAIVVSHDRELLERMDAIVELNAHGAARTSGGHSAWRAQKAAREAAAARDLGAAERRLADIDRRAQASAERKARRDGAGKAKQDKGDLPRIVMGLRRDRSEDSGGAAARLAERRRGEAADALAAARGRIEVAAPLSAGLAPSGLVAGKRVLEVEGLCAGHDPARPAIRDLSFAIAGPERVAVTGPNGAGKTTLLATIAGALAPLAGRVSAGVPLALLDQQAGLIDPALSIRDNFLRLHPGCGENACRAALARFMFRADAALATVGALSGGQRLRAGLACVLGGPAPPQLLLLDEPTNHLDLDAVGAVEEGLAAYDGALLVVSHDEAFLEAIGIARRIALDRRRE